MIKEIIVVEGKDDVSAVKRAVDADIIITDGYKLKSRTIKMIKNAQKTRGVIVLTDPDHAGEMIRRKISSIVKGVRHAYIPQDKAIEKGDIGVENASPETILEALTKARATRVEKKILFTMDDMIDYGLTGNDLAAKRRLKLGNALGIGYSNAKQFLNKLNTYEISKEELVKQVNEAMGDINDES